MGNTSLRREWAEALCASRPKMSVDVSEVRLRWAGGNLPERSAHGSGAAGSHHRPFGDFLGVVGG